MDILLKKVGHKCLIFALTKKNKKVLEIYKKLWNEIKNQIEVINGGESIKYKKDFLKIIFDLNYDDPSLYKVLSIPNLRIVVKSVFQNETSIIHKFVCMNVGINASMIYKKYT